MADVNASIEAVNHPPSLVCNAGHKLLASVHVSLDIAGWNSLQIAHPEGDDLEIYCESEGNCSAGIDPIIERRAAALVYSFPGALPSEVKVQACRSCGCTQYAACENGCTWITDELCSSCSEKPQMHDLALKSKVQSCTICQSIPHDRFCPNATAELDASHPACV